MEPSFENLRERVDALKEKETDSPHESPIYDLAEKEEEYREKMKKKILPEETLRKLAELLPEEKFNELSLSNVLSEKDMPGDANNFSDVVLEKLEAEKQIGIDELTGLRKQTRFKEDILQMLSVKRRDKNSNPLSILMLDIDFFKTINDEYGHMAGDVILKNVAHMIENIIHRHSDFIYRYGGEEFALILPDTTAEGAAQLAEKIREAIEKMVTDYGKEQIKQTISVGISQIEQLDQDKDMEILRDDLIKAADAALYMSKNNGRNKVTVFEKNL